jgi:hypothetical protein
MTTLLILVIVLIALVVGWFIYAAVRKNLAPPPSAGPLAKKDLPPHLHEARRLFEEGLEIARRGNYREGIRIVTLAVLLLLDENRVLAFEETMTNAEYLAHLTDEHQVRDLLSRPFSLFEAVIYGERPSTAREFERFVSLYRTLEEKAHG